MQQEETITESVLLDLRMARPSVHVHLLTRPQETQHGADWIWWWQGRRRWFGAMIQAKKRTRSGTYHFNSAPFARPGLSPRPRQIDSLHTSAAQLGLPALYALYRAVPAAAPPSSSPCPILPLWPGADGIMVLDALVARWLADFYGAGDVPASAAEPLARPLSCLASCIERCPGGAVIQQGLLWQRLGFDQQPEDDDLAWRAALTTHLTAHAADRQQFYRPTGRPDEVNQHTGHSDRRIAAAVREAPPAYVTDPQLMAEADFNAGEMPDGVGVIVIVNDSREPRAEPPSRLAGP